MAGVVWVGDPSRVETIERQTLRFTLVLVLREHSEWTLDNLLARMHGDDPYAAALRELTIGDLAMPPPIGPLRLDVAKQAKGSQFDEIVLAVVRASKYPVKACYLRARVGGPRWKLQDSLGRLVEAGKLQRSGRTAGTRYTARRDPQ